MEVGVRALTDFIAHLGKRADLPLRALNPKDIRGFRDAETESGKSPVTVNLSHKTIAGALQAAVRQGFIQTNPAAAVDYLPTHEDRGEKGIFTPEEIAKLIESAASRDWKGVIRLGAYTLWSRYWEQISWFWRSGWQSHPSHSSRGLARHERHPRKSKASIRSRRDRSTLTADEYGISVAAIPAGSSIEAGNRGCRAWRANPRLLWLRWLRHLHGCRPERGYGLSPFRITNGTLKNPSS